MNAAQFLLILNARKWIILGIAFFVFAATVAISLMLPKEYTATTTVVLDFKGNDPVTGQMLPVQLVPGYLATQVDIINSRPVMDKVIDENHILQSPGIKEQFMDSGGVGNIRDWLATLLWSKLDVQPSKESSTISISFKGTSPEFAALMANSFAKAYIQTNLDLEIGPAKQVAAWYDQQMAQLRQNLADAQEKLTTYQREHGILGTDERIDVETRRLEELAGQLVQAQSASYDSRSRASHSQSLPEVIGSPIVQNIKVLLTQKETELSDLSQKVGKNHPEYKRLQAEIDGLRAKLASEMKTAGQAVSAVSSAANQREAGVRSAYEAQRAKLLSFKKEREEVSRLSSDAENAQHIYDAALQRYVSLRMQSQSNRTDISVLNAATAPAKPSSPKVILWGLIAFLLALPIGIAVGIFVEMANRRVRTGADLEDALEIPLLAEISKKRLSFFDILSSLVPGKLARSSSQPA